jgi:RNA polymerase sigma-70 factor (ECF subfamily)
MLQTANSSNCTWQVSVDYSYPMVYEKKSDQVNGQSSLVLLVDLARRGDLGAFNQLVLAHQDVVFRQAFWILGQEEAAEDVTQEVFLRAFRNLQSCRGETFKAWILRIATNLCLDQMRREKCRPSVSLDIYNEYDEEIDSPYWLVDSGESPEDTLERGEKETMIADCLRSLSEEYRLVILLIDLQEMDYQIAASVLGVSLGTIKSRLFRARAKFREIYDARTATLEVAKLN